MTAKLRPIMKKLSLVVVLAMIVSLIVPAMGVAAQAGSLAAVNTGRLNVRTGPGIEFKDLTSIPYNTIITLIGRASKGTWVQVQLADGTQGWVNSTLLRTYADLSLLPITYNSDAPPPPTTNVPPPNGNPGTGSTQIYIVKAGDDLKTIAARYGTTWQILAAVNGLSNANIIYPGQRLIIAYSAPVPSSPSPSTSGTHVVKQGETLKTIAALYGVTPELLAATNGITNVNLIYAGQVLKIPQAPRYYTVQAGDTLASIATKYGVSIQSIVTANNITNINLVKTGQQLVIP